MIGKLLSEADAAAQEKIQLIIKAEEAHRLETGWGRYQ
jgi:hypothetical protein